MKPQSQERQANKDGTNRFDALCDTVLWLVKVTIGVAPLAALIDIVLLFAPSR
ncbi:MAG TPA: hypothetical protein VFB38_00420 [Chthonomonadaceae bacterium]|nr:hypothetical protein [Chthonomonadaceae bacterium]